MKAQFLKEYIYNNGLIMDVLEKLGCHHIRNRGEYYQAANPDGDNVTAICVYNCPELTTVDYTRQITKDNHGADLISLVMFFEECSFFQAMKWLCECAELDYYYNEETELPESLRITQAIYDIQKGEGDINEDKPLKPISENILRYYLPYPNIMFENDNISWNVQDQFEVGYDPASNRITIPIRDEIGNLVGVKGRLFKDKIEENELKYIYIEPCNRSAVLYGLCFTYQKIQREGKVLVTESEKGVMQLCSMGYYNAVGIGGKKVSHTQIYKLTRLCVDIIFLFDKDVPIEEIADIARKFDSRVNVYAVIDRDNILEDKESPTDNAEKFKRLIENNIERIER